MIPAISKALRTLAAVSAAMLVCPVAVLAQTGNTAVGAGMPPAQTAHIPEYDLSSQGEETHPMIRLTPDNPLIVHLDSNARSLMVGNPAHLNAILDTVRTVVLVPRDPGATYLTVIGKDGKVIMQRHVIVAAPAEKYIRIRRNCAGAGSNSAACVETSMYYCPDMCYETKIISSTLGQPTSPPAPGTPGSLQQQSGDSAGSSAQFTPASPETGQGEGPTPQSVPMDPATDQP